MKELGYDLYGAGWWLIPVSQSRLFTGSPKDQKYDEILVYVVNMKRVACMMRTAGKEGCYVMTNTAPHLCYCRMPKSVHSDICNLSIRCQYQQSKMSNKRDTGFKSRQRQRI
jgi:hypothetical protein